MFRDSVSADPEPERCPPRLAPSPHGFGGEVSGGAGVVSVDVHALLLTGFLTETAALQSPSRSSTGIAASRSSSISSQSMPVGLVDPPPVSMARSGVTIQSIGTSW